MDRSHLWTTPYLIGYYFELRHLVKVHILHVLWVIFCCLKSLNPLPLSLWRHLWTIPNLKKQGLKQFQYFHFCINSNFFSLLLLRSANTKLVRCQSYKAQNTVILQKKVIIFLQSAWLFPNRKNIYMCYKCTSKITEIIL